MCDLLREGISKGRTQQGTVSSSIFLHTGYAREGCSKCSSSSSIFQTRLSTQQASSAAMDYSAERFSFQGSLLNTKSPSSAAFDSLSGKLPFSRISLSKQKALHQLPVIRPVESFLFMALSLNTKSPPSGALIQSTESFLFLGSLSSIQKALSSAACDSVSGKLPFSRLSLFNAKCSSSTAFDRSAESYSSFKDLSRQCKMLVISRP